MDCGDLGQWKTVCVKWIFRVAAVVAMVGNKRRDHENVGRLPRPGGGNHGRCRSSNDVRERGRLGRIEPMTDRGARLNYSNPVPESSPAGCGQECPRSRRALETATAFGSAAVPGRINPMTDRRACFNHANPAPEHSPAGGGEESPRSHRALETATAVRSAAVPGRINLMTDRKAWFNDANPAPECSPVGCGEESPRSYRRVGNRNGVGRAAVSAASIR